MKPIARIVVLEGGQAFPCVARVLTANGQVLYTTNIYPSRRYEEAYRDAADWATAHGYCPRQEYDEGRAG